MQGFLFESLTTLVVAAHLIAVNVAVGGPLVCIWLHRRHAMWNDRSAGYVGHRLAVASIGLLIAGTFLGALALGLDWLARDHQYFNALAQFPMRRFYFAGGELAFSLILMLIYALSWNRMIERPGLHTLIGLLAATNLLYHFPPLMVMISVVSTRPELAGEMIDVDRFRSLLLDGEVISRTLHAWVASLAVTGVYVMRYSLTMAEMEEYRDDAVPMAAWGARIALAPTLIQLIVGILVLLSTPRDALLDLLGGNAVSSALLVGAIVATLAMIHDLAAAAMSEVNRRQVQRVTVLMVAVLVLMTAVVRGGRRAANPYPAQSLFPEVATTLHRSTESGGARVHVFGR